MRKKSEADRFGNRVILGFVVAFSAFWLALLAECTMLVLEGDTPWTYEQRDERP